MERLECFLKEISVSLFTDLSSEDQKFLGKDIKEVLSTEASTTLKNLTSLYDSLFAFSESFKTNGMLANYTENQGYQKALQKLDTEVRDHFKIELQMKVLIESLREKHLKALKVREDIIETKKKLLKEAIKENARLKCEEKEKDEKIKELRAGEVNEVGVERLKENAFSIEGKIIECNKVNERLKKMILDGKCELKGKIKEMEKQKKDYLQLSKLSEGQNRYKPLFGRIGLSERQNNKSIEILTNRKCRTPKKPQRSKSPIKFPNKPKPSKSKIRSKSKILIFQRPKA